MKSTILIAFGFLLVIISSCAKDNSTIPSNDIPPAQIPVSKSKTTFIYRGNMKVEKYDSNMVAINNYYITNLNSQLFGTKPNYKLSVILSGSSLKGLSNNEISVNIPATNFNTFVGGTGIFVGGVLSGYNSPDSLYYFVLYKNISNENIYLTYSGKLTNSF